MRPIHGPIDGFMVGICKAWEAVKFFLIGRCPSSNEELLRQPLIWNFIFSDVNNKKNTTMFSGIFNIKKYEFA